MKYVREKLCVAGYSCVYREDCESYKGNSKKEKLILSYADNFRRQYRQLYGDRKALFLTPVNEYDIEVGI